MGSTNASLIMMEGRNGNCQAYYTIVDLGPFATQGVHVQDLGRELR